MLSEFSELIPGIHNCSKSVIKSDNYANITFQFIQDADDAIYNNYTISRDP